jgi:hypothetical protein
MKICEHSLRDHLRLLSPLFGLIAAVWALRMVLYAAGAPHWVLRWCSVTVAGAACVMLAVFLIYVRSFGSYPNVVLSSFLILCWQQLLIVAAIAFTVFTGTQNVYSAPEFSGHFGQVWHILGHLTFGLGLGTLFGSAMGCLLLWLLRKLVPLPAEQ